MATALKHLGAGAPTIVTGVSGGAWSLVLVVAVITIFLHGADPAMRWLDLLAQMRGSRYLRNGAPVGHDATVSGLNQPADAGNEKRQTKV
jgi:hypothetical protein